LVLPGWTATARADLTGGTDIDTTIKLQPIAITGRITQSGKPARARVALRYGANVPKSETDEQGNYALHVWTTGRYQLEITPLEPAETEALLDMLVVTGDQTVDVDLPANRFTVRVVDAKTRKPIAGAHVSVSSARKNGRSMRQVTTSAEGVASLPPLYPGELVLRTSADGYLEGQPFSTQVVEDSQSRAIEIALVREEDSVPLTIALPTGAPADGAEVVVVRDLQAPYGVLWQGRTDDNGTIRIPSSMNGAYVAVRHTNAAGTIRPWPAQPGATWKLQPPAETLALRSRPASSVTAWIDGVRVSGYTLQFLTWSTDSTDGQGIWFGRRLPPAPLRVLIGNTTPAHDALATQIAYPWNAPHTIEAVE
ncbi:MAG: collagen binding domain-containing protein, partial [Thermoanaerobaculia bacterium]